MINRLIDGISLKINAEFGDNYRIYTEEVTQGLKTPCFFINALNPKETLFRGKRYFQTNEFCVQYIPSSNNKKSECNDVRERLFDSLEYITIKEVKDEQIINSLVRGTNMSGEYVDGVLNFFVNFDMYVYKEQVEAEKMNTFDYESNMKG